MSYSLREESPNIMKFKRACPGDMIELTATPVQKQELFDFLDFFFVRKNAPLNQHTDLHRDTRNDITEIMQMIRDQGETVLLNVDFVMDMCRFGRAVMEMTYKPGIRDFDIDVAERVEESLSELHEAVRSLKRSRKVKSVFTTRMFVIDASPQQRRDICAYLDFFFGQRNTRVSPESENMRTILNPHTEVFRKTIDNIDVIIRMIEHQDEEEPLVLREDIAIDLGNFARSVTGMTSRDRIKGFDLEIKDRVDAYLEGLLREIRENYPAN